MVISWICQCIITNKSPRCQVFNALLWSVNIKMPISLTLFSMCFVPLQVNTSQYGARDTVPCATDGTRQHCEWLRRKEIGSQYSGQSRVLHAHLNGYGAFLGRVESSQSTSSPTKQIAEAVVTEHNGEGPKEEHKATGHEVVMNGGDYTAYNYGQTGDTDTWHQALYCRERWAMTVKIV